MQATAVSPRLRGRMPTDPRLPLAAARLRLLAAQPPPDPLTTRRPGPGVLRSLRDRQRAYLAALADVGNVRWACRVAGIASRTDVYRWRADRGFVERERMAREGFLDRIRAQLAALALRSDVALMLMAKVLLAEYRPRQRQDHAVEDALPARFTLALAPRSDPEDKVSEGRVAVARPAGRWEGRG
jgi:hypothetical protein